MKRDFLKIPVTVYTAAEFFDLVKKSFNGIKAWRVFGVLPSQISQEQIQEKWKYPPSSVLYTMNGNNIDFEYAPKKFLVPENEFVSQSDYREKDMDRFMTHGGNDSFIVWDKNFEGKLLE